MGGVDTSTKYVFLGGRGGGEGGGGGKGGGGGAATDFN